MYADSDRRCCRCLCRTVDETGTAAFVVVRVKFAASPVFFGLDIPLNQLTVISAMKEVIVALFLP
jgi:hypothetical protein